MKNKSYDYGELFCYKYCCACCIQDKRRRDTYERDLESVDRIMDIREMIKNGGNLSVLSNVFLKDYQIKLIPHLDTDEKDENEKAALLTDEEALDILYKGQNSGRNQNEYQKAVDAYLMRHIDEDFLEKFGDENRPGGYKSPYNVTNKFLQANAGGFGSLKPKTVNRNNEPSGKKVNPTGGNSPINTGQNDAFLKRNENSSQGDLF